MEDEKTGKRKLSAAVVEHIMAKVTVGALNAGDVLPSERKLSADLGVSRTVIREAQAIMRDNGIIEINNGICTVRVIAFDTLLGHMRSKLLPDKRTATEVMQMRILLETFCAGQAAENATEEEIEGMQMTINRMSKLLKEGVIAYEQEAAFHAELIKTARNNVMNRIYASLGELLTNIGMVTLKTAIEAGIEIVAVQEHQAILDAVKAKDKQRAVEMMDAHLQYASRNLQESYGIVVRN